MIKALKSTVKRVRSKRGAPRHHDRIPGSLVSPVDLSAWLHGFTHVCNPRATRGRMKFHLFCIALSSRCPLMLRSECPELDRFTPTASSRHLHRLVLNFPRNHVGFSDLKRKSQVVDAPSL